MDRNALLLKMSEYATLARDSWGMGLEAQGDYYDALFTELEDQLMEMEEV